MKQLRRFLITLICVSLTFDSLFVSEVHAKNLEQNWKRELEAWAKSQKKDQTVAEFYAANKEFVPPAWREEIENLVANHPNEKIPQIEVQRFKDAKGVEQIRLKTRDMKSSYFLQPVDDEDIVLKINDQAFTAEDFEDLERGGNKLIQVMEKANNVKPQKPFRRKHGIISALDFVSMSKEGRAKYILNFRSVYEALIKLQEHQEKSKVAFNFHNNLPLFLIQPDVAEATVKVGQKCLFAGWFSEYRNNQDGIPICSAAVARTVEHYPPMGKNCGSGNIACNQFVYGYTGEGMPYCVKAGNTATYDCGQLSKIDTAEQRLALVRSVEANLDIKMEKGKIEPGGLKKLQGFLDRLRNHLDQAEKYCVDLQSRKDQVQACDEIKKRMLAFEELVCAEMEKYQPGAGCTQAPPEPVPPPAEVTRTKTLRIRTETEIDVKVVICEEKVVKTWVQGIEPRTCYCSDQIPAPGQTVLPKLQGWFANPYAQPMPVCVETCPAPLTAIGSVCLCPSDQQYKDGKCEPVPPPIKNKEIPRRKKDSSWLSRNPWIWPVGLLALGLTGYGIYRLTRNKRSSSNITSVLPGGTVTPPATTGEGGTTAQKNKAAKPSVRNRAVK